MVDKKFFSIIKGNIECAFCKEPNCPLRYEPYHAKKDNGLWKRCKKEYEKDMKRVCNNNKRS